MRLAGAILGVLAGLVCTAAGIYLMQARSGTAMLQGVYDATTMDVVQHGMGLYFIGKGLGFFALTAFGVRATKN